MFSHRVTAADAAWRATADLCARAVGDLCHTWLRLALVVALPAVVPGRPAAAAPPVLGMYRTVVVERGDTLNTIGRRFDVNIQVLATLNDIHGGYIQPGRRLALPQLHVLPITPAEGVVLNIAERQLYIMRGSRCVATYPVAVGQASWPTVTGDFTVTSRVVNPQWKPTRSMVERTLIRDEPVPPGPENPVGDRWIGWSEKGYGFHSTTAPETIGSAASHGCVRLYPEAARRMFELVRKGDPIYSVYRPVVVGRRRGRLYLCVCPDVYRRGGDPFTEAKALLSKEIPLSELDMAEVAEIARNQEGFPIPLHMATRRSPRRAQTDGDISSTSSPHRRLWTRSAGSGGA